MKTRMFRLVILVALILGLLLLGVPASTVRASTGCSWNGSIDANWSTPGNWGAGCSGVSGIPGTGDALTFPTGASNTSMNDDLPAISLQSLSYGSSLGYTLSGTNTISLTSGIDVQGGSQTINAPLAVSNSSAVFHVASGSSLMLGGTLAVGANTLTASVDTSAGVTGLTFQNTITGGLDYYHLGKISKNGLGDLRFIGDDEAAFLDIDLNAGTISTNPAAWTYLPYSGTITLASGTTLNLLSSAVIGSIAGSGDIHSSGIFQDRQYRITTFTGDLFGSNQLAIVGGGQLTIDRSGGSLSYAGEINVNAGPGYLKLVNTTATSVPDFVVNGNGENAVLELQGSHVGVINLGYPDISKVYSGTLLLSGASANSAGLITVRTPACAIGSVINSASDYGQITVTSPVDLGSAPVTFSLSGSYVAKPGDVFNIIHNTNSGTATKGNATFSGLAQGGMLAFNSGALLADYQAGGNTTFALMDLARLFLPVIMR